MRRPLPTDREAQEILARRKTRPSPRPAPRAGKALAPLIREMDERFGRGAAALEGRWVEIVGERIARVSRPQKLTKGRGGSGGTLELRVPGAAALLIQHQEAEIIEQVNLFLGPGAVERLRIAQGPIKPLPAAKVQPAPAPAPPPLPAGVEAELARELEAAPEGLRAALARLGRAVLSRETGGS